MRARNEGSIAKVTRKRRDGTTYTRYKAVLSLGTKPDGTRQRLNGPLRATRPEAATDLAALRKHTEYGMPPDRQHLDEYLLEWVEHIAVKDRTRDTYRADIKNHIIPAIGRLRLCDVTPAHVNYMIRTVRASSVSAARKARSVLHNALEDARLEERINRNPASVTPVPPTPRADLTRWQPEHAAAFIQAAKGNPYGPVFLLTIGAGLRIGEALGLLWEDLDGDVLFVRRQLRTVGKPLFDTPKTKRSVRKLRLGQDVVGMLIDHRMRLRDDGRYRVGEYQSAIPNVPLVKGRLMFPNHLGGPLRLDVLRNEYAAILAAAKVGDKAIPAVRIHDLRHYHLSKLISMGVDAATVSRRAGHSRTSTTMDIYVEAFDDQLERLAVSFDDLATTDVQPTGRAGRGKAGSKRR